MYCSYFLALDVAPYLCQLSFCTFFLARFGTFGTISDNQSWSIILSCPLSFPHSFLGLGHSKGMVLVGTAILDADFQLVDHWSLKGAEVVR